MRFEKIKQFVCSPFFPKTSKACDVNIGKTRLQLDHFSFSLNQDLQNCVASSSIVKLRACLKLSNPRSLVIWFSIDLEMSFEALLPTFIRKAGESIGLICNPAASNQTGHTTFQNLS